MLIETLKNGNTTLEIHSDDNPDSPRSWDNLGTMLCKYGRYDLGDKHSYELKYLRQIEANKEGKYIVLPLYLYDHSGITMRTTPFSCPWDSGQVGVIFVEKNKVREEYGWKVITAKRKEKILERLKGEVETYDQYLRGEVYGFRKLVDGEEVDSCWGFYGSDHRDSGLFENAGWKYEPKTNKENFLEILEK